MNEFLNACRTLAEAALRREPDPRNAIPVWLGYTGKPEFRQALLQFLVETKSDGTAQLENASEAIISLVVPSEPNADGGHAKNSASSAQPKVAPSAPESDGTAHSPVASTANGTVAVPSEPNADGTISNHPESDGTAHADDAATASSPISVPSEHQIKAKTEAAKREALIGFAITEHNGSHTDIGLIEVVRLDTLEKLTRTRVNKGLQENFVIRALQRKRPAYSPDGSLISDVFSRVELNEIIAMSKQIGHLRIA